MKNFLIICCCMYFTNLTAQYAVATPIENSILPTESFSTPGESANYTKLSGENCTTEIGFGLSECGSKMLTDFMAEMSYPTLAYELSIEDKCTVSFTGTKEGTTENIVVSDCIAFIFNRPIQEHLSKLMWQPVYKNGKAIDFNVTFETTFKTEL